MRVRVLLLGVLALGLGAAELEISLRPSAVIDSPQVHLADIAALSDVDGELQETLAGVQVRRLPDLGDYTIDGHEVQVLLRRQLGLQAAVTGTSQVRRASKRFSASELDELAIAHLKDRAEDRQIKVRVRRQAAAQTLPLDAQQPITIKA